MFTILKLNYFQLINYLFFKVLSTEPRYSCMLGQRLPLGIQFH